MDVSDTQDLQQDINGSNRQGVSFAPVETPSEWRRYLNVGLVTASAILGGVACGVGEATACIAASGFAGYISYQKVSRKLAERQARRLSEAERCLPVNPDDMVPVDLDSTDSPTISASVTRASSSTGGTVSETPSCQSTTAKKRKASVSSDALHPPCSKGGNAINTTFPAIKEQSHQSSISEEMKETIKSAFNALTQREKEKALVCYHGPNVVFFLRDFPNWVIKKKISRQYLSTVNHLRSFVSQSRHLHIPDMIALDDQHVLEEKIQQFGSLSYFELVDNYIKHKNEFTPAVRDITDMLCRGVYIGPITHITRLRLEHLKYYLDLPPLILNRADGTTEYKIGLVNIDFICTINAVFKPLTHTNFPIKEACLLGRQPLRSINGLATLYPLNIDDILTVTKKYFILDELEESSIKDNAKLQKTYLDTVFPTLQYYERKPQYEKFLTGKEGNPEQIKLMPRHLHELEDMSKDQSQVINELLKEINGAIIHKNQENPKNRENGEDNRIKARTIGLMRPVNQCRMELGNQYTRELVQKQSTKNEYIATARSKRQKRHSPYPLRTSAGRSSETSNTTPALKNEPLQAKDRDRIEEYRTSLLIDSCDFLQERGYIYTLRDLRRDANNYKLANNGSIMDINLLDIVV